MLFQNWISAYYLYLTGVENELTNELLRNISIFAQEGLMLITQVDRLIDIMLFYDINIIGTYRYLGLSGSGLSFLYYRILGAIAGGPYIIMLYV